MPDSPQTERHHVAAVILIPASICVALRIVFQFVSPVFSTKAMRLQCQYCVALLAHYVTLIIGEFLQTNTIECKIIAILEHYFLLETFVWMAILSVDMYKHLTSLANPITAAAVTTDSILYQFRQIAVETCVGWGSMIPFTVVAACVDTVDSVGDRFKLKFGASACWAATSGSGHVPYYIGVPVALVINVITFVLTVIFLRKAFTRRQRLTLRKRSHYAAYVKLMIFMGVHYLLFLFVPHFDNTVMRICMGLVHAFQGIYIAVAFVFTKKVWASLSREHTSAGRISNNELANAQSKRQPCGIDSAANTPAVLGSISVTNTPAPGTISIANTPVVPGINSRADTPVVPEINAMAGAPDALCSE